MKKLAIILGFLLVGIEAESSILSSLREKGNYTYYLRLIEDVNAADLESYGRYGIKWHLEAESGDLTVFAADDAGWQRFFEKNAKLPQSDPWHTATSYEALTKAQKHLLCDNSIIFSSSIDFRNEIRFPASREVSDRVEYLSGSEIPFTYNPEEKWYWERFSGKGLYLANDSSFNYISLITPEKASYYTLLDMDFNFIFGSDIYDKYGFANGEVIQQKFIASNGTIYNVETPLKPLQSMAEVIRTNGQTNIFSHILDRFSAPFFSYQITNNYRMFHPEFQDSVFIKRYFSKNNYSTKAGYVEPNTCFEPGPRGTYQTYYPYNYNPDRIPALKFDPGWSAYCDDKDPGEDMAAMFVPSDKQMWYYFTRSAGQDLIYTYYVKEGTPDEIPYTEPTSLEELYQQIDAIPVGTLDMLINNLMQTSFVNSVPSKWVRLTDDAGDPLFEDVYRVLYQQLDTCLLANNGVVYVMDRTCVPADFRFVTAPAVISTNAKIMKTAIYGSFMGLNYDAFLKNRWEKLSFFLPTDKALEYYYDPASMKSRMPRVMSFSLANADIPVQAIAMNYYCQYNADRGATGTVGSRIPGSTGKPNYVEITNRLKEILESHVIVHDSTCPLTHGEYQYERLPSQVYYGLDTSAPLPEYYLSKNGCPIKVTRDMGDRIIAVKGGFQLENERQGIDPDVAANGVLNCRINKSRPMDNGYAFILNAPMIPTYRSVWSIFTNDADWNEKGEGFGGETPYSEFYRLCMAADYEAEIIGCGLVDESLDDAQRQEALDRFKVFVADNGLDYNVKFFNNYHYTIFVPTNEAIQQAIANGLPTWEDIYADYHSHCAGASNVLATHADSIRIAAKINYLTQFVRNHFADKSVFADKPALEPQELVTASYDRVTGQYRKIHVERVVKGSSTNLNVCDDETWQENGNSMKGAFTTVGEKNVLARDISCSKQPVRVAMKGITIDASNPVVIQSIPGCLNHTSLIDGRHDKTWETIMHDEDAIQDVKANEKGTDNLYDISGRKVSHPTKGIYIQNGKKVAHTSVGRKP